MKSPGVLKKQTIISIDPSTRSLAYVVMNTNDEVIEIGHIDLSVVSEFKEKLKIIGEALPMIIDKYKPAVAVIEEAVFIQNFKKKNVIAVEPCANLARITKKKRIQNICRILDKKAS